VCRHVLHQSGEVIDSTVISSIIVYLDFVYRWNFPILTQSLCGFSFPVHNENAAAAAKLAE
jgi:hypothetical protein